MSGASDLTRAVLPSGPPSNPNSATRPVTSPAASPVAIATPLKPPPLPPPLPGAPPVPARRMARPQRPSRWRVVLVGLIALIAVHELLIWDEVQSRVEAAETEPLDADRWWSDYQDLQDRAWFGQTTAPLARVLTNRFTTAATATLREFRDDVPDLRVRQYADARDLLTHAVAVNPSSATTRAWLENAEGHLARIAGEDRRAEPRADRRRQKLLEAVSHFEQAARLDPRLPDPYLGLARIYAYGMRSPERARQALAAAEERGHRPGKREHAERGDLLDAEARELYRQARQVRGSAEEEPALLRAREHWQTALDEYAAGAGFADADGNARRISGLMAAIDTRLTTIHDEQAPVPSPLDATGPESDAESLQ
jgi:tetratricopeptide (TPR) repeat protein